MVLLSLLQLTESLLNIILRDPALEEQYDVLRSAELLWELGESDTN